MPIIKNALNEHTASSSAKLDLPSYGPQQSENGGMSRKTRVDFPKLNSVKSNHNNHPRESSVDSYGSDEGNDNYISLLYNLILKKWHYITLLH